MGLSYFILDTETTGLGPKIHEIVEISIIRCSDRHQLSKVIRAEYPEKADWKALQIIGKTKQDIIQGEDKLTAVQAVNDFLNSDGQTAEHRVIVAHNAAFDKNFCHALWTKVGQEFPATAWLDTKPLAKSWAVKLGMVKPKLTLAACLEFSNLKPFAGQHNAKSDSRNTYLLWKKAMDENTDIFPFIKRHPHILDPKQNAKDYLLDDEE